MIYLDLLKPQGIDFPQYYSASRTLMQGINPYLKLIGYVWTFNYPPTSFLFLYWWGMVPENLSGILWNIFSLASYLISIWLLLKTRFKRVPSLFTFVVVTGILTLPFFPEKFNLGNGQINNFILLFVVLSFYFKGRKDVLSAFFLSFASAVKLVPIIYLLDRILEKDWKYVGKFVCWILIFVLLSFLIVSPSFQVPYFSHIFLAAFSEGGKNVYYNQSLAGFMARSFTHPETARYLSWIVSLVFFVFTILRYKRLSFPQKMSVLTCLYLIVHPLAWQHHFVFAIIPLILLFPEKHNDRVPFFLLTIAYGFISWNFKEPNSVPFELHILLSNQFIGIVLLWILAIFGKSTPRIISILWILMVLIGFILIILCRTGYCL